MIYIIRRVIPQSGAFRGAAVLMLAQASDNAANGRIGLARRVKINLHKIFYEIFGLEFGEKGLAWRN